MLVMIMVAVIMVRNSGNNNFGIDKGEDDHDSCNEKWWLIIIDKN